MYVYVCGRSGFGGNFKFLLNEKSKQLGLDLFSSLNQRKEFTIISIYSKTKLRSEIPISLT